MRSYSLQEPNLAGDNLPVEDWSRSKFNWNIVGVAMELVSTEEPALMGVAVIAGRMLGSETGVGGT